MLTSDFQSTSATTAIHCVKIQKIPLKPPLHQGTLSRRVKKCFGGVHHGRTALMVLFLATMVIFYFSASSEYYLSPKILRVHELQTLFTSQNASRNLKKVLIPRNES